MRRLAAALALAGASFGAPGPAEARPATRPVPRLVPRSVRSVRSVRGVVPGRRFWLGAAGALVVAAALDRPLRDAVLDNRGPLGDRLARVGDALGRGRNVVGALALSYAGARVAHERRWADATLRVAAGYAVANVAESALKGAVGRERPYVSGRPDRFHPFVAGNDDYHSFPSAHVTHAGAIAGGVAVYEGGRAWLAGVGYGATALVGWQRVYSDEHWTSDAVAGAVIGAASAETVVRWLERRAVPAPPADGGH